MLLDLGGVFVDRARTKVASRPLRPGQVIEFELGGAFRRAEGGDIAGPVPHDVVYEDDDIVVVNKPAGVITAPTPESDRGNLADTLKRRGTPVWVVHRIDRPTSGLLVFAKTEGANRVLSERFAVHDIVREYEAVVVGHITAPRTLDAPIDGKRAVTHIVHAEPCGPGATRVVVRLETGRQHQIRIHLAGQQTPIAGDHQHERTLAGSLTPSPPRLALHARLLGIVHPRTGAAMSWHAQWPADLAAWTTLLAAK